MTADEWRPSMFVTKAHDAAQEALKWVVCPMLPGCSTPSTALHPLTRGCGTTACTYLVEAGFGRLPQGCAMQRYLTILTAIEPKYWGPMIPFARNCASCGVPMSDTLRNKTSLCLSVSYAMCGLPGVVVPAQGVKLFGIPKE